MSLLVNLFVKCDVYILLVFSCMVNVHFSLQILLIMDYTYIYKMITPIYFEQFVNTSF